VNKKISKWAVFPGLILSLIIALLFLSEWINIGVIANPEIIDKYYFGSDSMVGKYWYYESATIYALTALVQGIISSGITVLFVFSLNRNSKKLLVISYSLLGIGVIATLIRVAV